MNDNITIYCKNTNNKIDIPYGTTLQEILSKCKEVSEINNSEEPFLGALVNNKVRDLSYRVHKPAIVEFFDYYTTYGRDMYVRSLFFLLSHAVDEVMTTNVSLRIKHSLSGGRFCTFENYDKPITDDLIDKLLKNMRATVEKNLPIERLEMLTEEAMKEFKEHNLTDKMELFKSSNRIFSPIHKLGNSINFYFSYLVPSTGYLKTFGLEKYETGMLLKLPSKKNIRTMPKTRPLPKLFSVYKYDKEWAENMGVPYVYNINQMTSKRELQSGILVAEAYQEKRIAAAADMIHSNPDIKMVLISGPSSSGKTTTCRRLSVQLAVLGYNPVQISVDDFFVERDETPLDENGEKDFESLYAIDLPLFNRTLNKLVEGEEVEIPTFDFAKGSKIWNGKKLKLRKNSILVIEGIHCLNPELTAQIADNIKFKIFVSALTSISIDRENPVSTADNRLLRRLVRDYNYRGYSAIDTLRRWSSVRRGEEKNIFPFQENADYMINTSLIYEIGVLRPYAMKILLEVPQTAEEYADAIRLMVLLSFFNTIPESALPGNSILREFVGGSKFSY